jgi:hypothetical protein
MNKYNDGAIALAFLEDQLRKLNGDLPGGSRSTKTARLASSANTTNATLVSATARTVGRITVYNTNAAARYLKIYDKATAPDQNDVPIYVEYLPPTSKTAFDLGGLPLTNGLGYRMTTGAADNDNTAVGAGDLVNLNILYG